MAITDMRSTMNAESYITYFYEDDVSYYEVRYFSDHSVTLLMPMGEFELEAGGRVPGDLTVSREVQEAIYASWQRGYNWFRAS